VGLKSDTPIEYINNNSKYALHTNKCCYNGITGTRHEHLLFWSHVMKIYSKQE